MNTNLLENQLLCGDNLEIMRGMPDKSVDLVFTSPPYENRRKYGIDFCLSGDAWVDWAFERYMECMRVCKGLVAWVVEGKTEKFQYSATPILLAAKLHKAGVKLRKPPIYHRVGIPGSGGPEWLRNNYEFIICASHGRLPWSNNKACGKPPKYSPGGEMSHRVPEGGRVNWSTYSGYDKEGKPIQKKSYKEPDIANPGNVLDFAVGGGKLGSPLAHENEAPFPLELANFFVKSFCPPDGIVLDCFIGSGTTAHSALINGRNYIGIDCRQSQIELTQRRLEQVNGIR